jgi:hypothetical protein
MEIVETGISARNLIVMKPILTLCILCLFSAAQAQQKQPKKEPPKVIMVKKTPTKKIVKVEEKKKAPVKTGHKPIPKVEVIKSEPPGIVDTTKN